MNKRQEQSLIFQTDSLCILTEEASLACKVLQIQAFQLLPTETTETEEGLASEKISELRKIHKEQKRESKDLDWSKCRIYQ